MNMELEPPMSDRELAFVLVALAIGTVLFLWGVMQ